MTTAKRYLLLPLLLTVALGAGSTAIAAPKPVVLELFTSHSCSSCPPADALLRRLSSSEPFGNVRIIPLSEHVTYWNNVVSRIGGGENNGRRLREDGVVRQLQPAGALPADAGTARHYNATLTLPQGVAPSDLSVVSFVQRRDSQAIVGAASQPLQ